MSKNSGESRVQGLFISMKKAIAEMGLCNYSKDGEIGITSEEYIALLKEKLPSKMSKKLHSKMRLTIGACTNIRVFAKLVMDESKNYKW